MIKNSNSSMLWVDKYKPKSIMELAIHTKKIQEVTNWISKQVRSNILSPILLITGPPGCGKTAIIYALPDLSVITWNESMNNDLNDFSDFLLKSSRYSDIDEVESSIKSTKKVILIESFPNIFYNDPTQLHDLLIRYKSFGKCPLIIILSDSKSQNYSEYSLIPKALQLQLNMDRISFNPIATLLMKKCIQNIIKNERKSMVDKEMQEIITSIIEISNGDIRSAINNLQMMLNTHDRKKDNITMNKDNPLFIYRALGKILYCKRETDEEKINKFKSKFLNFKNNPSLSTFRAPLIFSPEDVFDTCNLNYSTFTNFLHENYLDFIQNIDQLSNIGEDFSYSDSLFNHWSPDNTDLFGQYLISTVTRSMLYHNESRPKSSFHALRKSAMGETQKKIARLKSENFENIFPLQQILNPTNLFIDNIPHLLIRTKKTERYSNLKNFDVLLNDLRFNKMKKHVDLHLGDQMPVDDTDISSYTNDWRKKKDNCEWIVCKVPNEDNVDIE